MELIKDIDMGNFHSRVAFITSEDLTGLEPGLVVVDRNTKDLLTLPRGWNDRLVVVEPGEKAKNWSSVETILSRAVELELDRSSRFIGIGGGVICDMTAFAASVYMRGCAVSLIPTTLLAMVDAAVGGKTGMDFLSYKNMVGSFYPAEHVFIEPQVLNSLSEREYLSGMAEAIKTAWLGDEELFSLLESKKELLLKKDHDTLKELIRRCVTVKGTVVEEDLKEKGIRAWLNLGHTFGHALESATGFDLVSHGEAVAWGMACALDASEQMGLIQGEFLARARKMLDHWEYRLTVPANLEKVKSAMLQDKKKSKGQLRFILMKDMKEPCICPVEEETLNRVLTARLKG